MNLIQTLTPLRVLQMTKRLAQADTGEQVVLFFHFLFSLWLIHTQLLLKNNNNSDNRICLVFKVKAIPFLPPVCLTPTNPPYH